MAQCTACDASSSVPANSDTLMRLAVQAAEQPIVLLDLQGTIVHWNVAAERLYGYPAEDMVGQMVWRLWGEGDQHKEQIEQLLQSAERTGLVTQTAFHPRHDGRALAVSLRWTALKQADGSCAGFSLQIEDQALPAMDEQFQRLVGSVSDCAIITLDTQGHIQHLNHGAEALYGYPTAEAVGMPYDSLFDPQAAARQLPQNVLDEAARHGSVVIADWRVRRDGFRFWARGMLTALRSASGQLRGYAEVCRDDSGCRWNADALSEHPFAGALAEAVAAIVAEADCEHDMLQKCAQLLAERLNMATVRVWMLDERRTELHLQVSVGLPIRSNDPQVRIPVGSRIVGQVAAERKPTIVTGQQLQAWLSDMPAGAADGLVAFAACPLKVHHRVVGVLGVFARHPLGNPTLDHLSVTAAQLTSGLNRTRSRRQVSESEEQFRRMVNAAPVVLWLTNAAGNCVFMNDAWTKLSGQMPEDASGSGWLHCLHPDDRESVHRRFIEANRRREPFQSEYRVINPDGEIRWVIDSGQPRYSPLGEYEGYIGCVIDVTQRRALEDQMRQSQKMEAFGQLAGSVAHDFNNLLTIISGHSEILADLIAPHDPLQEFVSEIAKAGERAASLTRQLLAFSRQNLVAPRVISLNDVVSETEKLLRRLIGEDIVLQIQLQPDLPSIRADANQCDQVLINLAVNARDAMPTGGTLSIRTASIYVDERYAERHAGLEPGVYVRLSVSDTGCGMTPEVKARLFEPFFTTKPKGKGTGLGLAVVHGIVHQNGGHIDVSSEPGYGTVFHIYFPATQEAVGNTEPTGPHRVLSGTESLLLVEDEPGVRKLALHVLQQHGYRVLVASNGRDALNLVETCAAPIDLLVTDVVMPQMGGPELARELQARRPTLKVLFLSGYTDDAIMRHGIVHNEVSFLQKPFTPMDLAKRVRAVLDSE